MNFRPMSECIFVLFDNIIQAYHIILAPDSANVQEYSKILCKVLVWIVNGLAVLVLS